MKTVQITLLLRIKHSYNGNMVNFTYTNKINNVAIAIIII